MTLLEYINQTELKRLSIGSVALTGMEPEVEVCKWPEVTWIRLSLTLQGKSFSACYKVDPLSKILITENKQLSVFRYEPAL